MPFVCSVCGYQWDEEREGAAFAGLPSSFACPSCGAPRSLFRREGEEESAAAKDGGLSPGQLAALCSYLARACGKQQRAGEAVLYHELSRAFAGTVPTELDASMGRLSGLIAEGLTERIPAVRDAAVQAGDRGALRACEWSGRVTAELFRLLRRYREEGGAFLKKPVRVCRVCGFPHVGEKAPEQCPVCHGPGWKFEEIEGRSRR